MYNKQKMIDKLERAKDIVCDVYNETNIDEVGDMMCFIDESIAIIENE